MPQDVTVALDWTVVHWDAAETWNKTLLPRLLDAGLKESELPRCVYVIRLQGIFAIAYPEGESPTVYVGKGRIGQRLQSHKKWASELRELVGVTEYQLCVAAPRVKNQPNTYTDCEAAVIQRFRQRYGSAPLWNKKVERRRYHHHHYSQRKIDYAIGQRSGARYKWALQPMRASPFYVSYQKTHV